MADNVVLNSGLGGSTLATDDVAGIHYQIVKVTYGALDSQTIASSGNGTVDNGCPRVTLASDSTGQVKLAAGTAEVGKLAAGTAEIGNVKNSGTFATQATLQAGTAEFGKLAAGTAEIGNVKNAGTFAVQISDTSFAVADGNALGEGVLVQGDDGTDRKNINVDASTGDVQVDVTNTVTVDLGANNDVSLNAGTNEIGKLAAGVAEIGNVKNAGTFATQATLQAGTAEFGKLAAGTAEIGNVKNAGTFAVQIVDTSFAVADGNALGEGVLVQGDDGTDRKNINVDASTGDVQVDVTNTVTVDLGANNDVSLNAGTNAFGKLSANSGVDIGDVDVTSISAGSNLIGDIGMQPRTSGGISTVYRDEDIDETDIEIKGSAGQIYWIHVVNLDATPVYLHFWDVAAASVTVGTTAELVSFCVPSQGDANGAGFTMQFPHGIEFGTAITVACTTTISGTAGPGANEVLLNVGYE